MKKLSSTDWPKIVRPGSRVFIGSGAGVPQGLISGLLRDPSFLHDVELVHIHTLGPAPWLSPDFEGRLRTNTFFLTPDAAAAVRDGRADYTPCSMSDVPRLFRSDLLSIDVALITVSPPDAAGRFSLGVSVDVVRAAVDSARIVVAQINPEMPRTCGQSMLDADEIDWFIEESSPLPELPAAMDSAARARIGAHVAALVDDGATLQVGIGRTPQDVLRALRDHRQLGIHSGMFSDGLMELIRCGAVDNSRKKLLPGKSVASHALGSDALYRFVHENEDVHFRPSEWVNDPAVISRNERVVALNGARQIDLTGQVVRDASGHEFHGGIGAQLDFLRGAAASPGGRPICVLPSTSDDGKTSRVLAGLPPGTGVATSRADVAHVVTEFGIASLRGRSIRERVLQLIQIAHPDFREDLLRGAHERGWLPKFVSIPPTSARPDEMDEGVEMRRLSLGDGSKRFFMRPLHPADMRRLQTFFYSHDEDTLRMRYGYIRPDMPMESAWRLVAVDQSSDLALGIFEESGAAREPVLRAIGRYYRDADGTGAEVAFVVGETTRRMGMASVLLETIARIGGKRGITTLRAEVLAENKPMRALFEKFGGRSERSPDIDGYLYHLDPPTILKLAARHTKHRKSRKESPARRIGWFWSEACLAHDTGPAHVESAERYKALGKALKTSARKMGAIPLHGREITRRELLRVHAAYYLDLVHIDVESLADRLRTGDTAISPESEHVAKLASGAALDAVDHVMRGDITRAFVAVRPPGHHATPDRGMGFCIYNHVALMARHAQEEHGCGKVLIVDWDVHHGNGTQDIFFADPSVFFFSTHQAGLFPHTGSAEETGAGPGAGTTLNVPLPAGSGLKEILPWIEGPLTRAMESFEPSLVLISAGFDSRVGDPLGDFTLTDDDYATLTRAVGKIADRWAGGKLISILEGGYNPEGLAKAAAAHFRALADH